jgi:hypothetical protein
MVYNTLNCPTRHRSGGFNFVHHLLYFHINVNRKCFSPWQGVFYECYIILEKDVENDKYQENTILSGRLLGF